jgi:hypothetical protein
MLLIPNLYGPLIGKYHLAVTFMRRQFAFGDNQFFVTKNDRTDAG